MSQLSQTLQLIPASKKDAKLLLDWRNDPAMRSASRFQGEIEFHSHLRWLESVICDPNRHLLIGYLANEPVGQVRFDLRDDDDAYEIAISVDKKLRGNGIGLHLINEGSCWLWKQTTAKQINSYVRHENKASQRVFEKAGFTLIDPEGEPGFSLWIITAEDYNADS